MKRELIGRYETASGNIIEEYIIRRSAKAVITGLIDGEYAEEHLGESERSYYVRVRWVRGYRKGTDILWSEALTLTEARRLAIRLNREHKGEAYEFYTQHP